jgi:hypothetical protein
MLGVGYVGFFAKKKYFGLKKKKKKKKFFFFAKNPSNPTPHTPLSILK